MKGGNRDMATSGRVEHEGSAGITHAAITNSLEQVREILCGAQHRELARRLSRTDAQLAAQADELRAEARRRLDLLEGHVRREMESLNASLDAHRAADAEALGNVARESREALGLIDQRIRRLEELVTRTQRELRQQMLEQANAFIDETRRTREELSAAFERELAAWGGDGADVEASEAPASDEAAESGRYRKMEHGSEEAA